MPKTKISEYSTTNSANTDIQSINIDEGCAPSGINNAIREIMVHLKNFQTGASGDPLTVAGGFVASSGSTSNTMTVTGILTASGGTILSSTNTLSGSNIISGNITAPAKGTVTTDNDGSFDMNATNNFLCTPTGNFTLTFTNITAGQSGNIVLVNGSNYTVSAAAATKVASTTLATISATGTYWLTYYSPDGTNVYVANTGALA